MKKILLFLIVFFFIGCVHKDEIKTEVMSTPNYSYVKVNNGILSTVHDIREFQYKGHTYVYTKVKEGISIAHAGHCNCKR